MNDQGPKKDLAAGAGTPDADALREGIERTRGQMSATVNKIEERLSPAHIEEQVKELKESVLGNYHEAKDHLKEDISRELRDAKSKVQGEIEHARTAVRDATVGRVEHMVHDARDMVHSAGETVTEAGGSVLDTIKANPIPAALVAVGVGWLIVSARQSSPRRPRRVYVGDYDDARYGYGYGHGGPRRMLRQGQRAIGSAIHTAEEGVVDVGHRVQHGAEHLAHQASDVAHDIGGRVGAMAHDVGERVHHLTDEVGHYTHDASVRGRRMVSRGVRQVRRAEQSFESKVRENPLAFGAVALAVGAAIGLALPSTRPEDEWMGPLKERLIDRAEGMAGEAIHVVEEKVTNQLAGGSSNEETTEQEPSREDHNGISNGLSGKTEKSKSKSSSV